MRRLRGERFVVVALLMTVLLDCVLLRRLFFSNSAVPDLEQGWFESVDGRTQLALGRTNPEVVPSIDLANWAREIGVPAGMTAALTINGGFGVVVQQVSARALPYVVIGRRAGLSNGAWFDGFSGTRLLESAFYVDQPTTPRMENGALVLAPWEIDSSMDADVARLRAIASACEPDDEFPKVRLQRVGDDVVLDIGRCTARAVGLGAHAVVGVIAGPTSARVARSDGARWDAQQRFQSSSLWVLPLLGLRFGIVALAFGVWPTVILSGVLLVAGVRFSFEAILIWILATLVAGALVLCFLWVRGSGRRRILMIATPAVALLAVLRGPGGVTERQFDVEGARGQDSRCIVSGYSTAMNMTLEDFGSNGVYEWLNAACLPCRQVTSRVAEMGANFEFVRESVCSQDFPGREDADLIFVGGSNDDFMWGFKPRRSIQWVASILAAGRMLFTHGWRENPDPVRDPQVSFDAVAPSAAERMDEQLDAIRSTLECARKRGIRFFFFHDFMVYDVLAGRSSEWRRRMLLKRRTTVEAANGTFVDLLAEFRDRVGVSWFNDQIHLSAVGHRRAADLICGVLQRLPPA